MHITGVDNELRRLLELHQAIYKVRRDEGGRRISPLVGYAGKYDDGNGEMKAYVGEVYFDFAMIEQHPRALRSFAEAAKPQIHFDVVLGMPMGGIAFSFALASATNCRFAFAEKKVTRVATGLDREASELVISRHTIGAGSRVLIGEDVCNNFSTTASAIRLIEDIGAEVVGIVCAINRSCENGAPIRQFAGIPVFSALDLPTEQYRQDHPYVKGDIESGNVVWKPKEEWGKLIRAMIG